MEGVEHKARSLDALECQVLTSLCYARDPKGLAEDEEEKQAVQTILMNFEFQGLVDEVGIVTPKGQEIFEFGVTHLGW